MLPGISGALLAPTFLERTIEHELSARRDWQRELRELHKWWRRVDRTIGPATAARSVLDTGALPFFEHRGYHAVHIEPHREGFVGMLSRDGANPVALRVAPWGSDAEREWRDTVRAGRTGGARWGFVYTGHRLRIVDAMRTWSRRSLDFEFGTVLSDERSATALLALVEAAGGARAGEPALDDLIARSERHGVEVCASLGDGVLEALSSLFIELGGRRRRHVINDDAAFEQAVTIVYRLLFLLFAEARALVPTWHQVYRNAYTVDALCRRSLAQPSRRGLWKTLQAIARLAHRGCQAGDLVVTPFNGRLFSPRHTPLAERAQVSDAVVGQAVVALATSDRRGARERIAYGDLGVEQLGAVYERVLEYEPTRSAGILRLTRTAHDRKATGSFYTPRSVTDFLVRRALHPLVEGKSADQILKLRVLDPAMGSGAFLVAACRYLADAVERALAAEQSLPSQRTSLDRAAVRRRVAQQCLFGVDLNPMAVQLARLSLWLASLSSDRPLTFLDHHLAVGDSLVGASFADLARSPGATPVPSPRRPPPLPLFDMEAAQQLAATILPERFRIAAEPGDTPDTVHAKERALAELSAPGTPLNRWKAAADLWCAAWFWGGAGLSSGIYHDILAAITAGRAALNDHQRSEITARAREIADEHRFFHWELEFPEVFFTDAGQRDPTGGFDVVLGNPPWDVLRADTGDASHRARSRDQHRAMCRFFRDARIYRHQGGGHVNRYQLFLERALQLAKPGGRLALILPSGVATDQGSALLRRQLLDETTLERVIGFDNRAAIFPIHRDVRFLLLTATKGGRTDRVVCALGQSHVRWLDQVPDRAADDPPDARPISISRSTLAAWDPEHLAIPWITRREDLQIVSMVADRIPPLSDTAAWNVRFGRELNATDDRPHFVALPSDTRAPLLTVIEGKHLEPFRVLAAASRLAIPASRAATLVDAGRSYQRPRLAYRDVASATNRLTLIAARLSPGTISTHTIFCSKDTLGADAQYCLLALLNSLVANYLVRLRVTTHVTTAVMGRLRVPRPRSNSADFHDLAALARALEKSGIPGDEPGYARLNTIAARLYGLTYSQYEHVLSTFPLLPRELVANMAADYAAFFSFDP